MLGAVQARVQSEGNGRVHVSERECRSRHPERARALARRGLERAPWSARAAAGHWVMWMVAHGSRWREDWLWLFLYASIQRACSGNIGETEGGSFVESL
jgi:hypothetical protein